ncbi:MAG: aldose epimerase family protein [Sporolactobacillus sp.]
MQLSQKPFGTLTRSGDTVYEMTLTNARGTILNVISYGATWRRFIVTDVGGVPRDLVLFFDELSDYETNPFHLGNTIGRVAGRLANASFVLNGRRWQLEPNNHNHLLHGGAKGMDKLNWYTQAAVVNNVGMVQFSHTLSGDGFPGSIAATVTYTLNETDEVSVTFSAESDADTLFNPMTHVYFNLADGQQTVLNHLLQINSRFHAELDTQKLPTGRWIENAGTGFDFSMPRQIGDNLNQLPCGQLDDAFLLDTKHKGAAVVLSDPASGRRLLIDSDRNAAVIFTANPYVFGQSADFANEHPDNGVAIEMQMMPDAIHHHGFGDIILPAHQKKTYRVTYRLERGK